MRPASISSGTHSCRSSNAWDQPSPSRSNGTGSLPQAAAGSGSRQTRRSAPPDRDPRKHPDHASERDRDHRGSARIDRHARTRRRAPKSRMARGRTPYRATPRRHGARQCAQHRYRTRGTDRSILRVRRAGRRRRTNRRKDRAPGQALSGIRHSGVAPPGRSTHAPAGHRRRGRVLHDPALPARHDERRGDRTIPHDQGRAHRACSRRPHRRDHASTHTHSSRTVPGDINDDREQIRSAPNTRAPRQTVKARAPSPATTTREVVSSPVARR